MELARTEHPDLAITTAEQMSVVGAKGLLAIDAST
jgi:hypothetical protein